MNYTFGSTGSFASQLFTLSTCNLEKSELVEGRTFILFLCTHARVWNGNFLSRLLTLKLTAWKVSTFFENFFFFATKIPRRCRPSPIATPQFSSWFAQTHPDAKFFHLSPSTSNLATSKRQTTFSIVTQQCARSRWESAGAWTPTRTDTWRLRRGAMTSWEKTISREGPPRVLFSSRIRGTNSKTIREWNDKKIRLIKIKSND